MSTNKAATEDVDHTDGAVVNLCGSIEVELKLQRIALGIGIGLHVLREGRRTREKNR